jgi:hypothetical protein
LFWQAAIPHANKTKMSIWHVGAQETTMGERSRMFESARPWFCEGRI